MTFDRITVEPGKMNGQPCIRGLRIPVATVVAMVADGMTAADDQSIVTTAAQQDRVIVSADTDVGTLLAQSGARSPSVLLLRLRSPRRARQLADLLLANLAAVADDLDAGPIVVLEDERVRVRRLPI